MRKSGRPQRSQGSSGQSSQFGSAAAQPAPNAVAIGAFFAAYKAPDENVMASAGIEAFCTDLGISVLDPVTLVVAYRCRAQHMGIFTEDEFTRGMSQLGCVNLGQLKMKLPDLRVALTEKAACKEIYLHTFQFALDEGQRSLPLDVCVELWKILLPCHFALLNEWIEFVEQTVKSTISRDTWMMVYDLATQVKPDLSNYEDDCSWPVLLDEFVESVRAKNPGGVIGGS